MPVSLGPVEVERDQWGRPLIQPAGGGKKTGYQRCTTFVGALENTHNLTNWKARQVLLGIIDSPELALKAHAHREDKKRLDEIAEAALDAAGGHDAAERGTATHKFTEYLDRGESLEGVPAEYLPDLEAYRLATQDLEPILVEQFVVLDDIKVAGTADRIVKYVGEKRLGFEPGRHYIADVKTGRVDWGFSKIEMQLAVYAHGEAYDLQTHERTKLPEVSHELAIVMHLPAGTGTCQVYGIPIKEAWDKAVQLAQDVHTWRKRKRNWAALGELVEAKPPTLEQRIAASTTADAVRALWAEHVNEWSDELTAQAKQRVAALASN